MKNKTEYADLELQKQEEAEFFKNYDSSKYEKPSVTVDMLIFSRDKEERLYILLIKRGGFPDKGKWAIPGGFIRMSESLEESAQRELQEETGISDVELEQVYTFGDVNRDPRGRTISVTYLAILPWNKISVCAGDDAADARWFLLEEQEKKVSLLDCTEKYRLSTEDLAFDHDIILSKGLEKIKSRGKH